MSLQHFLLRTALFIAAIGLAIAPRGFMPTEAGFELCPAQNFLSVDAGSDEAHAHHGGHDMDMQADGASIGGDPVHATDCPFPGASVLDGPQVASSDAPLLDSEHQQLMLRASTTRERLAFLRPPARGPPIA